MPAISELIPSNNKGTTVWIGANTSSFHSTLFKILDQLESDNLCLYLYIVVAFVIKSTR